MPTTNVGRRTPAGGRAVPAVGACLVGLWALLQLGSVDEDTTAPFARRRATALLDEFPRWGPADDPAPPDRCGTQPTDRLVLQVADAPASSAGADPPAGQPTGEMVDLDLTTGRTTLIGRYADGWSPLCVHVMDWQADG